MARSPKWGWQSFGGPPMLVTSPGARVVLCANGRTLQTRDEATGLLRPLATTDEVALLVQASPELKQLVAELACELAYARGEVAPDWATQFATGDVTNGDVLEQAAALFAAFWPRGR